MPYEQARDELIEVVRRLEGGGLTLEESLKLWERGERLAAICLQWLEGARARLAAALPAQERAGRPGCAVLDPRAGRLSGAAGASAEVSSGPPAGT